MKCLLWSLSRASHLCPSPKRREEGSPHPRPLSEAERGEFHRHRWDLHSQIAPDSYRDANLKSQFPAPPPLLVFFTSKRSILIIFWVPRPCWCPSPTSVQYL